MGRDVRRSWRVRVCEGGDYGRTGVVVVTRRWFSRFYQHGIRVARVDLTAEDAEHQLAEARARARSLAAGVTALEEPL